MALPFCKVSANRREYKTNVFVFILEAPPNFTLYISRVSANRREYKTNVFVFILEAPPNFTLYMADHDSYLRIMLFEGLLTAVNLVARDREQLVRRP